VRNVVRNIPRIIRAKNTALPLAVIDMKIVFEIEDAPGTCPTTASAPNASDGSLQNTNTRYTAQKNATIATMTGRNTGEKRNVTP
jgi:hypothetical protein